MANVTQDASTLLWLSRHRDVQVLRWPEDMEERAVRSSTPCLWLVEPGAMPPEVAGCLEDWVWSPADDVEMHARLAALEARARRHPRRPTVDAFGELSFGGRSLFLSPIDERIAGLLIERYGRLVKDDEMLAHVWPSGATAQALRVHISRLRRAIRPLGLTIVCVRCTGYLLREAEDLCE